MVVDNAITVVVQDRHEVMDLLLGDLGTKRQQTLAKFGMRNLAVTIRIKATKLLLQADV